MRKAVVGMALLVSAAQPQQIEILPIRLRPEVMRMLTADYENKMAAGAAETKAQQQAKSVLAVFEKDGREAAERKLATVLFSSGAEKDMDVARATAQDCLKYVEAIGAEEATEQIVQRLGGR